MRRWLHITCLLAAVCVAPGCDASRPAPADGDADVQPVADTGVCADTTPTADVPARRDGDDGDPNDDLSSPDLDDMRSQRDDVPDSAIDSDAVAGCALEPGRVVGRVCGAGGAYEPGHVVRLDGTDCQGVALVLEAHADDQGFFEFPSVPPGEYGATDPAMPDHGRVWSVSVDSGRTTTLTSTFNHLCWIYDRTRVAVLSGNHGLGDVLDDLGVTWDLWLGSQAVDGLELLASRDALLAYDLLIIEDGPWGRWFDGEDVDPERLARMLTHLEAFVNSGGGLLVTGNAVHWLERLHPAWLELYGDPSPVSSPTAPGDWGTAHIGASVSQLPIDVRSVRVRESLGGTTRIDLTLDAGWPVVLGTHGDVELVAPLAPIATTTVHGELVDVPMMVTLRPTATAGAVRWMAFSPRLQPRAWTEALFFETLYLL